MENISTYLARLDQNSQAFSNLCANLTEADFNHALPGGWSVKQVLGHLIASSTSYYPIFDQVLAGTFIAPWHSRIGFLTRFFDKVILDSVEPNRKRKMKTFPIWEPVLQTASLEAFLDSQKGLATYLTRLQTSLEQNLIIHSPASKVVVYHLQVVLEILLTHQIRHYNQAVEILNSRT